MFLDVFRACIYEIYPSSMDHQRSTSRSVFEFSPRFSRFWNNTAQLVELSTLAMQWVYKSQEVRNVQRSAIIRQPLEKFLEMRRDQKNKY